VKRPVVREHTVRMKWRRHLSIGLCCTFCAVALPTGAPEQAGGPQFSLADVPWLSPLQGQQVVAELQALVDEDIRGGYTRGSSHFKPDFGPNSNLTTTGGWAALSLLNRGRLSTSGCRAAPLTCAALGGMLAYLTPRSGQDEVGARLLKLDAGATLRPHVGPGGRRKYHAVPASLNALEPDCHSVSFLTEMPGVV
jgi:hypothetical protein